MSNPFERLRALARWSGDDDDVAPEAASALCALAGDPGLVVACRRMLAHHPTNSRMWWLLANVLASPDPRAVAQQCRDRLDADRTAERLGDALPLQDPGERLGVVGWNRTVDRAIAERIDIDCVAVKLSGHDPTSPLRRGETDRPIAIIEAWELATANCSLVVASAVALDDRGAVVPAGFGEMLWELGDRVPVWLVAATGSILPRQLVDALLRASANSSTSVADERLEHFAFDRVARIVTSRGSDVPAEALVGFECPVPAELLRDL